MKSPVKTQLVNFLRDELAIPDPSIATALRHSEETSTSMAMVLWQYGLITLNQLDQIFDWLETVY